MGKPKRMMPGWVWDLFEEYKIWAKANPYRVTDWVGAGAKEVVRQKERPLTLMGFNNFLAAKGWTKGLQDYFNNRDEKYNDYIDICNRIKSEIGQDQVEGGMAGVYNHSLTARLNNLVEKTENKHEVSEIIIKHES